MKAAALVLGLLLGGCSVKSAGSSVAQSESRPAHDSASHPAGGVRWYGALRAIMHEGRTEAAVRLSDVLPGPHAWAVGALEGLHGEVTVLDDVAWLARPNPDGTAQVTRGDVAGSDAMLGAALLVVANVTAWSESAVPNSVAWSELDAFIEAELKTRNVTLDAPVALRIEGPVSNLKWHVVDGSKLAPGAGHAEHARTAVSGLVEQANVRLVGFFSTAHQGVFTHAGSHSHFHVVIESQGLSGHVDGMALQPGARLLVAKK